MRVGSVLHGRNRSIGRRREFQGEAGQTAVKHSEYHVVSGKFSLKDLRLVLNDRSGWAVELCGS